MTNDKDKREWWIEFGGDPSDDKELYKRYCGGQPFEPTSYAEEVIHVVPASRLESANAEIARLNKILKSEFNENDELGAEYLGITIVRDQNRVLESKYRALLDAAMAMREALEIIEDGGPSWAPVNHREVAREALTAFDAHLTSENGEEK